MFESIHTEICMYVCTFDGLKFKTAIKQITCVQVKLFIKSKQIKQSDLCGAQYVQKEGAKLSNMSSSTLLKRCGIKTQQRGN